MELDLPTFKLKQRKSRANSEPVLSSILRYEKYLRLSLNLIPSENVLSQDVLRALSSEMAGRYAGRPESYGGSSMFHEIWEECESLACQTFHSRAASASPISGHIAAMMVLDSLAKKGEKILALSSEDGGYKGYTTGYIPDLFGLDFLRLPLRKDGSFRIDLDEAISVARREKPSVIVLGATVFLFPHPVRELAEEVHKSGGCLVYDGSHVLGLIAGGEFQDPLSEGADVLLGSTHKTFFGPQGGIILSNDVELMKVLEQRFLYRFMDNFHLNRVAALCVALKEVKLHGRKYAHAVVRNSRKLGKNLGELGHPVAAKEHGITESHQVLLNFGHGRGEEVRNRLEACGIIVDSRVRLGTNEVSRRGMKERDMEKIASLIDDGLSNRRPPSKIRKDSFSLMTRHQKVCFTLR